MMGIVTWITIVGGMIFIIWYGYGLLVKRPGEEQGEDGPGSVASCHLCRRTFPVRQMIHRDKIAGFINYFCGDCIEALYNEYVSRNRDAKPSLGDTASRRMSAN